MKKDYKQQSKENSMEKQCFLRKSCDKKFCHVISVDIDDKKSIEKIASCFKLLREVKRFYSNLQYIYNFWKQCKKKQP
jgi:hypothetical protein